MQKVGRGRVLGKWKMVDFSQIQFHLQFGHVVWGYPPVNISRKAYQFTKELPDILRFTAIPYQFTAIPRSTVWGNMFKEQDPDKYDIGLYFSPIGSRSEQCYSSLVAHLEKEDIILKSRMRGVQLLIIPSSLLDEESKSRHFTEPAIEQQTVEMEIDMLGGAPVGRIDNPIPRISNLSCSKTSKARPEKGDGEDQCVMEEDNQTVDREIDKLGGTPIAKTDNPVPRDHSHPSPAVAVTQVKAEKWDGGDWAPPPGFPAPSAWREPRVPPVFEGHGRRKYKTISEILKYEDGRRS